MNFRAPGKQSKKEFPFLLALGVAIALHFLLGFAIKRNLLFAVSPTPPPAKPQAPVTMRFVEVPPESKTVAQPPRTNNVSDANRKAGPLKSTEPGKMKMPSVPGRPNPPSVRRQQQVARQQQQAIPASPQAAPTEVPSIEAPPIEMNRGSVNDDANTIPLNMNPVNPKQLSQSLQDLDRYIRNEDAGDGGIYSPNEGSPSGDTGSGVFFDTQGFDLGPWGNRVVAIVKKNWIVPVAAQLGMKGIVSISFEVDKASGNFINLNIVSSSGIPSFDQAALSALKSSNPLPPLPADFPRPTLPGVFRFYYNIPINN